MPKRKISERDRKTKLLGFKATESEAIKLKERSERAGYSSISDYLRDLVESEKSKEELQNSSKFIEEIAVKVAKAILSKCLKTANN